MDSRNLKRPRPMNDNVSEGPVPSSPVVDPRIVPGQRANPNTTVAANQPPAPAQSQYPRVNVYAHSDSNKKTITLALAGLAKTDVGITLSDNQLIICGESADKKLHGEGQYIHREFTQGKFTRMVSVPPWTRPEDCSAKMENGLLIISVPKDPPGTGSHRILVE